MGANFQTSDFVTPEGQVPGIGSLAGPASTIFSLKNGEMSGPIVAGADGIVAQLLERQPPSEQEFAEKKDQIRESLLEAKQSEMFQLFVTNLRKDMEKANRIRVNQEEMKNLGRQNAEEGS